MVSLSQARDPQPLPSPITDGPPGCVHTHTQDVSTPSLPFPMYSMETWLLWTDPFT